MRQELIDELELQVKGSPTYNEILGQVTAFDQVKTITWPEFTEIQKKHLNEKNKTRSNDVIDLTD